MANNITLAEKYVPLLDEVYKMASKTSVLDTPEDQVKFNGTKTVKVFKMDMDGLGTYSRATGFVDGDVNGTWEDLELTKDRGRSFSVDNMDNEETAGMAFGRLAGEFIRTKVVPEIDAYRFAAYCAVAGTVENSDVVKGVTNVAALIDDAQAALGDKEVPNEGKFLFISENAYANIKNDVERVTLNGDGVVNKNVLVYDDMIVIRVPKNRFNTAITLLDGTTSGQEAGGYLVPAVTSYPINFMIIHPGALIQIAKHVKPRIFSPEVNQDKDAWKFDYRIYHDALTYENKVDGIYVHRAATANQ
ncbi:MAG: hypothetical protein GX935_02360 [Erysipelotrichia bacterium]|nr:hypothetical protein [Erysipelotrichia bacterium]